MNNPYTKRNSLESRLIILGVQQEHIDDVIETVWEYFEKPKNNLKTDDIYHGPNSFILTVEKPPQAKRRPLIELFIILAIVGASCLTIEYLYRNFF